MTEKTKNRPRMVQITKIESEATEVKTLFLNTNQANKSAYPGQFIMVWIPGIDEIPLSLSEIQPTMAITVKNIGTATNALCSLKEGDLIGIRGPYGHGFSLKGKNVLIVGGGIGMAPLLYLNRELRKENAQITIVNGAKTENELVFKAQLMQLMSNGIECIFTTDDGSFGEQGFASTIASHKLKKGSYDYIYTCGPELMMFDLFQSAETRKIPFEASLERFMKCGIGICGSCCLDSIGYRVCVEGPVFNSDILRKISEFGKYERTPNGKKVKI